METVSKHHLAQLSLRPRGLAQARGTLAHASSFHLSESSTGWNSSPLH